MNAATQAVLDRLTVVRNVNGGWQARCPVPTHGRQRGDQNPSLSISEGAHGRVLLKCHVGCKTEDVVAAIGMTIADLSPKDKHRSDRSNGSGRREIAATYDYPDERGKLLFQVVRYEEKDFRQRRPNGSGGWIWNVGNVRRVLFRLPQLLSADPQEPVFVVEGEKDAESLAAIGLVATTNRGGAGKWRPEYSESLRDRHVVILPDNDKSGRGHARVVATSLSGVASTIRVVPLPGLREKGDASDWIAAGGTRDDLLDLIADAPEWSPDLGTNEEDREAPSRGLPTITITGQHLRDISAEALAAIHARNDPPRIFERGDRACRVRPDETGRSVIEVLSESAYRGELERSADFQVTAANGRVTPKPPPLDAVRDLMSLPNRGFPPLQALVQVPVLRPDGSIVTQPGYDSVTRLYYAPTAGLDVPDVPTCPTREEVDTALGFLTEVIIEFPFPDPPSFTNTLGLMLTPILRPAIDGPVPLALIDAPTKGTGKTLLAEVIATIATGEALLMGAPRREEEFQKLITSTLLRGTSFVILDNLRDRLRSAALERVLTGTQHTDRVLGESRMIDLPQRATWVGTANNVEISGDLSRRCYWIRLDAKTATPWKGRAFTHPELLPWVQANRGRLLAALLILARSWFVAGCPEAPTPVLGKFESFCRVVGGVLAHVGDKNFLGNLDEMYGAMDEEANQWEGFLVTLRERYQDQPFTVSQLVKDLVSETTFDSEGKSLQISLPDELAEGLDAARESRRTKGFSCKLGRALKRKKEVRYGEEGIRLIESGSGGRGGTKQWRVVEMQISQISGGPS